MTGPPPPFSAAIFGLPEWAGRLVLAGLVIMVALALLYAIAWSLPRLLARTGPADGPRSRQRQTAVSALATGLRYVVLVAALVALAFALAGGGGLAAVSGGALIVLLASFASQRLLVDVIAGFFILFEDQYVVGDVVRLEPSGYTGEVTALGLRTTELEGPGAERMIVPNGQITAVRMIPRGRRRHRVEFLTRDPDAVATSILSLTSATSRADGPWASETRLVRHENPDGVTRLIAILDVDVHREEAVPWLVDAVTMAVSQALEAPPLRSVDPGRG